MKIFKKMLALVLSLAMVLGTLTVTASAANTSNKVISADGTYDMDGNYYGSSGVALTVNSGVIATVNVGSYQIYNKSSNNPAIVNNGTLTLNSSSKIVYNYKNDNNKYTIQNNGTLTVGAGTTIAQVTSSALTTPVSGAQAIENNGTLDVNGAIIAGSIGGTGTIVSNITSGYFYDDMTAYCAAGYECVSDTSVTGCLYTVQQIHYVAQIGSTQYASLAAAVTAAVSAGGATIQLIDDITTTSRIELDAISSADDAVEISIDLNGHTWNYTGSKNGALLVRSYNIVNIYGGTVSTTNGYFFATNQYSTLNITGGTYTGATTALVYTSYASSTVNITGGSFSTNPSSYNIPAGYGVEGPTDGMYTVVSYAATVTVSGTTTSYSTLAAAVAAADAQTEATITLLSDIALTERLGFTAATSGAEHTYIFDLNGHTITYTGSGSGAFVVRAYDYLTIQDSSAAKTGCIDATGSTPTYKTVVATNQNSKVTFLSGNFKADYVSLTSYASSTVYVNGGAFYFDLTYSVKSSGSTAKNTLSGSKITVDATEGIYTVGTCHISGMGYATIKDALEAAANNDTITLCANVELSEPLQINTTGGVSSSVKNLTITDDGTARIIRLGFNNATTNGGIVIGAGKTVSFVATSAENIKILGYQTISGTSVYCNKPAIALASSGTLVTTLNLTNVRMAWCNPTETDATVNGGCIYNAGDYNVINLDGCSFESNTAKNGGCLYITGGELNISDTTFFSNTSKAAGGCIYNGSSVTTTIEDSTFGKAPVTANSTTTTYSNKSTTGGSAIMNLGTMSISGSAIDYNEATTNGAIYNQGSGTLTIEDTSLTHNTAKLGAAIYNYGANASVTLCDDVTVSYNTSSSSMGAIGINKNDNGYGKIYLDGTGITVSSNTLSGGTVQEGEEDNAVLTNAGDISLRDVSSLVIAGDLTGGNIGIEYPDVASVGDAFGVAASARTPSATDLQAFFCDGESGLKAYTKTEDGTTYIYWHTYDYTITVAPTYVRVPDTTFSYKLSSVTVSQDIYSAAKIVSLVVSTGTFEMPWDDLNIDNITQIWAVDSSDAAVNLTAKPSGSASYRALTIVVSDTLTDAEIQSFFMLPTYTVQRNAVEQQIYAGLQPSMIIDEHTEEPYIYFAGSSYSFHTESKRWTSADNEATTLGGHLVNITSDIENTIIHDILGANNCWLGAVKAYDAWYWQRGTNAGTKIVGNATSTEGYQGAYTNFVQASEPFGDYTFGRLYMTTAGKWKETDGEDLVADGKQIGHCIEIDDLAGKEPVASFSVTRTDKNILTAVSASYEEGLKMSYYFTFNSTTMASSTAKVVIKIGEEDATEFMLSDIVAGEATADGDYKLTVPVAPKAMADTVSISIEDGDNVRTYGSGTGYNLQYYALRVVDANTRGTGDIYTSNYSNDFYDMAVAMLHYGSAAQTQFNYNTDELADSSIDAAGTVGADINEDKYIFSQSADTFTSASLVSDSMTGLRIYFTGSASFATVNGKNYETDSDSNGNYVEFPIAAKELSKIYTVTVGEETCMINAYYVIHGIMTDSTATSTAKTTAYRLYEFGEAAAIYYGAYAPSVDRAQAVLNTAYAYLQKSLYVDYDQKQMADYYYSNYKNPRRQDNVSPEDASLIEKVYMDCSSFIYDTYYLTFGDNAAQLALGYDTYSSNQSVATVDLIEHEGVYSAGQANNSISLQDQEGGLEEIYSDMLDILQPGDVIVKYRYEKGSTAAHGHVVLWTGDGFIHCTGYSYDYTKNTDKTDSNGSIFYEPVDEFESEFALTDFHYVKVLRPLSYMTTNNITITDEGVARQQIGELGIDLYGRADGNLLYEGHAVYSGDVIDFTIDLDNHENGGVFNLETTVDVSLTLPTGLTFVSASDSGVLANGVITWNNITIAKDSEKKLTFSATVTGSTTNDLGANVIHFSQKSDSAGYAGTVKLSAAGINAKTIGFSMPDICVETVDANASTILTSARALRDGTQTTTETGLAVIEELFGDTTFNSAYTSDASLFGYTNNSFSGLVRYLNADINTNHYYVGSKIQKNVCFKYLVSNLLGGTRVSDMGYTATFFNADNRARCFKEHHLEEGDVIACINYTNKYVTTDATYTYFVYLGADEDMLKVTCTYASGEISSYEITGADPADTCDSLLGAYNVFAVLRFFGR